VKTGFLKDYLAGLVGVEALATPVDDQAHEMPIHGEIHTIAGGFLGKGCTSSQCKRHARSVMSVEEQAANDLLDINLTFTRADHVPSG